VSYQERAVLFACQDEHLVGILAEPANDTLRGDVGLVVVVGGPQYRVGSHRQFLHLSRSLVEAGIPVLRFDVRGMGDSTGEPHDFEHITPDIGAAIDTLQTHAPQVRRVVLWGLCDGASAALLYRDATGDERVHGVCVLNPWVRSEASLARAHVKHYYADRLRQGEFWTKLLSGKVAMSALAGLWRNLRTMARGNRIGDATPSNASFQHSMARAYRALDGKTLLLLSGEDYTAREFLEYAATDASWKGLLESSAGTRHDLAHADHTFSNAELRSKVEKLTLDWLVK
jgi:exosortase A-associated hydrolase 1